MRIHANGKISIDDGGRCALIRWHPIWEKGPLSRHGRRVIALTRHIESLASSRQYPADVSNAQDLEILRSTTNVQVYRCAGRAYVIINGHGRIQAVLDTMRSFGIPYVDMYVEILTSLPAVYSAIILNAILYVKTFRSNHVASFRHRSGGALHR